MKGSEIFMTTGPRWRIDPRVSLPELTKRTKFKSEICIFYGKLPDAELASLVQASGVGPWLKRPRPAGPLTRVLRPFPGIPDKRDLPGRTCANKSGQGNRIWHGTS